jgi:tellurite resistance protein TerC
MLAEHPIQLVAYGLFLALVLIFLALDLGVFHRKAHVVSLKEASIWTSVWITCALLFNVGVYFLYQNHTFDLGLDVPVLGKPGVTETLDGAMAAKQFFTGYVIEKSLSLDNVFVIAVVFTSLGIPGVYQHRVLFWGILGALVFRAVMIFLGAALVARFAWVSYLFAAILILTAIKMALVKADAHDPSTSVVVRFVKRFIPLTHAFDGQRFFTRMNGVRYATPLFLALVLVEFTDVLFAIDSIPAIFAITSDPFLVLTSNIFAILGLRSLYFCLAAAITSFRYLKPALIAVLFFVGIKMALVHTPFKIPTDVSLGVILGTLAVGVIASLLLRKETPSQDAISGPGQVADAEEMR